MRAGGGPEARPASTARKLNDHGVFTISLAGQRIGTENFDIRSSDDRIEAKAAIQLRVTQNGKAVELKSFPDLVLSSQFEPLTYTWIQKGSQSSQLEVDFRKSPAKCRYRTLIGGEDNRDFDLPKDVVVLDDNVLHQYELVVNRLTPSGAGPQTFKAFIPQEAVPGVLTVEEIGFDSSETNAQPRLRHLRVSTELTRIDLWVDQQRHLQRVAIPATQFEAVRKR
jgi:hypothetical protein